MILVRCAESCIWRIRLNVASNEDVKAGHLQKIKFLYRDGIYLGDREGFNEFSSGSASLLC